MKLAHPPRALALLAVALAMPPSPLVAQSVSPSASCPPPVASATAPSIDRANPPDITVFAAASLADAFEDLQDPWAAAHPGSELVFSFDASSTLRAQIEEGAPADVFASADTRNAQLLVDACVALGPVTPFAGNELVVVVPRGDPAGVTAAADLARPGVRVIAAGPEVPITRYARQVIEDLAATTDDPAAFVAAVTANTVSEEDNVRTVLAKIELGEGDAAIVYATDAMSSDGVESVPLPDGSNASATYAAVVVAGVPHEGWAVEFTTFLLSPDAQSVLERYGFIGAGRSQ